MGIGWMWQLTVPGYVAASIVFASLHGLAAARRAERPLAGDRPAGRARPRRGAALLVPVRRRAARQPRHRPGRRPVRRCRPRRRRHPHHLGGAAARLRPRRARRAAGDRIAVRRRRRRPGRRRCSPSLAPRVARARATASTSPPCRAAASRARRHSTSTARVVTARHLEATRTIEPDDSLDLVLWPENVIDVEDFATSEELAAVAAEAARLGVPIAVGITEDVPGRPGRITNAQVVVTPDGEVTSRYDKVRRVPFGEYVPLRGLLDALGAPVDQVPTNAVAGTEPAVIDLPDGTRLGVVISWEVFFGGRAREAVEEGGEALLNPTNGASYTGTIVQSQQVASSRLRAIETGRWVVQAAPTGFSEFVTPDGDVHRPHRRQRAGGDPPPDRAAHRPHLVRHARRPPVDRRPARRRSSRPGSSSVRVPACAPGRRTALARQHVRRGRRQRSMTRVTGPSLVSVDLHLGAGSGRSPRSPRGGGARRRPRRRAVRRAPDGRPRSSSAGARPTCRRRG